MANPIVENIAKTNADALAKSSRAAETIMKGGAETLTESGNASRAAVQELTTAYQELATKNVKNLTAAIQALSSVKDPSRFIELQQKLIKDGVEAAVTRTTDVVPPASQRIWLQLLTKANYLGQ